MSERPAVQCAELIKEADSIVALTGAGVSTKAGIPDFRGPQGLYVTRRYDPDTVFDIHYFHRDPNPFYEFARDFIGLEQKISPTFTHRFLARLEQQRKLKGIITQNIDSLHQMAGSRNVLEMHGSFWTSCCTRCPKTFSFEDMKQLLSDEVVPKCSCGGLIKPDIVFFGENVKCLNESLDLAGQADLFFVIGSSCVVYPAAMVPEYATGKIVVVNQGRVQLNSANIVLSIDDDTDSFFMEVAKCLED